MVITNIEKFTIEELAAIQREISQEIERRKRIDEDKLRSNFIEAFNACIEAGISIYAHDSGFLDNIESNGASLILWRKD